MKPSVLIAVTIGLLLIIVVAYMVVIKDKQAATVENIDLTHSFINEDSLWIGPSEVMMPYGEQGDLVRYGKELIAHTAKYFGPEGSILQTTNGLNCQNCHLDAGTKPWGNNYFAVASTYPKFRERSGTYETISKRINDCFERSLNGQSLDTNSREMLAIISYINWLGMGVDKGQKPKGSGIIELVFLDRAADVEKGKLIYEQKCVSCHQANGEGLKNGAEYAFPPLWGAFSYNIGAGLYRISRFAGYVKANMPLGASYKNPLLTDEEAWDLAAFVNTQMHPDKDLSTDWPNIAGKPLDHPFGPFHDGFSEKQHKYGPFNPIKEKREAMKMVSK
jgi:thiosulfate dehydrogenase